MKEIIFSRRDPEMLVRPVRGTVDESKLASRHEKVREMTPRVTRRLILIRHGQYNQKGEEDEERYLTELGREQARLTGVKTHTAPYCEIYRYIL